MLSLFNKFFSAQFQVLAVLEGGSHEHKVPSFHEAYRRFSCSLQWRSLTIRRRKLALSFVVCNAMHLTGPW